MKKGFVISIIVLAFCQIVPAKLITHRNIVDGAYNFWVSLPDSCNMFRTSSADTCVTADSTYQRIPAVIFLHGRSLCGTDISRVRRYGCLDALKYNLDIPAVIIAPQNPGETWNPRKIIDILEWAETKYPIDTNRVYVVGMSLGGFGTINLAGSYPDKIAAGMALCGGGTLKDYTGLCDVPLWIVHGKSDEAVSWKESQRVVDKMVEAGDTSRLRMDLWSGVNHSRLARLFYLQSTYDWLLSHSLQDSCRTVNKDICIGISDMENAYKAFRGHPKKTLEVFAYNADSDSLCINKADSVDPSGSAGGSGVYVVKKGDCLSKIAVKNHTTVSKLCKLNGISKSTVLQIGRKLKIR